MPETKRIVILANSIRRRHRCVAGKELLQRGDSWIPGKWIRLTDPVTDQGEVRVEHTRYERGGFAQVLDIADVSLKNPVEDPDHPEDWLLDTLRPWRKIGQAAFNDLEQFADPSPALWQSADPRTVPAGFISTMHPPASLYLIQDPQNCRASWWRDKVPDGNNPGESQDKTRMRLSLRFGGRLHEFDITDPLFTQQYRMFDTVTRSRQMIELKPPLSVCVSLTKPWQGKHYKIAATIFEANA